MTSDSARLPFHRARSAGRSTRFQQISRMPAAIAGKGMWVIKPAPATASSATQSAEKTPASGVRAPAS